MEYTGYVAKSTIFAILALSHNTFNVSCFFTPMSVFSIFRNTFSSLRLDLAGYTWSTIRWYRFSAERFSRISKQNLLPALVWVFRSLSISFIQYESQKMSIPNYAKSRDELNNLPLDWEYHPDCDKWVVLEAPNGQTIVFYMSARSYRLEGEKHTTSAAPELMYKRLFLDKSPTPVPFGRYEWHSVEWIVKEDSDYAEWLLGVADEWLQDALKKHLEAQD